MRAVLAVSFVYLECRGLEYLAGARVVGARVDDVTKEFAGLAPSVAALGLDRSVAERKGNSAVPLGAQSRSQARRRFHASPPLTRHR